MKNFLFETQVDRESYIYGILLVRANTQEEAQIQANLEMVGWWGTTEAHEVTGKDWAWITTDNFTVWAKPNCLGQFTESELDIVRRAYKHVAMGDSTVDQIIEYLGEAIGGGMDMPPDEMLIDLFGEALAARFKLELSGVSNE